jgi:glycosyltransferase involved in cell wall biosynthesis
MVHVVTLLLNYPPMAPTSNTLNYGRSSKMTTNSVYNGLISVIVSTYNWPKALKLVLRSLQAQSDQNFEVIIVDDGSTGETAELIKGFSKQANFPLKHLWQEDKGFRAARARNLGIRAATGDYIIFLDGDCITQKSFVSKHRRLAEPNFFIAGHRVILNQKFTQEVIQKNIKIWNYASWKWILNRIQGYSNKWAPKPTLKGINRYRKLHKWQGAKTCNLAFWKQDLLNIKGFDESFEGWGFEDSDLVIRILNNGIKRKSGKFATEVFHLWHKTASRSNEVSNLKMLEEALKSNKIEPLKGL